MKIRLAVIGAAFCLFSIAYAQDKLPSELAGVGMSVAQAAGRATVAPWSIVIESQDPDGAIKGKMSWSGRACIFTDLPFAGSYRDGNLELTAPESSPKCGAWKIRMKRTSASTFEFEGTAQAGGGAVSVTLKPR